MPAIKELLRAEADGRLSFGDYTLTSKAKMPDFEHQGDIYYVKTFQESTRLEKNGMFVYESVPGTAVPNFAVTETGVSFQVEGNEDAQITLELEEATDYKIYVDGKQVGEMTTNRSGKLSFSVELSAGQALAVTVEK